MMKSTAKPVEKPVIVKTHFRFVDPTAPYAPETEFGKAVWTALTTTNQLAGELRSEAGNHVINHKHVEDIAQKINDQMEGLRASVVNNDA